jgi:hypothetical protein
MHVLQLLNLFSLAPKIEIVEATLPELTGEFAFRGQPPGKAQLHSLNYLRGIAYQGFGNQQVHVLGHDHVSNDGKTLTLTHPFQNSKKQVPASGSAE